MTREGYRAPGGEAETGGHLTRQLSEDGIWVVSLTYVGRQNYRPQRVIATVIHLWVSRGTCFIPP